jgi:hypothetical protein
VRIHVHSQEWYAHLAAKWIAVNYGRRNVTIFYKLHCGMGKLRHLPNCNDSCDWSSHLWLRAGNPHTSSTMYLMILACGLRDHIKKWYCSLVMVFRLWWGGGVCATSNSVNFMFYKFVCLCITRWLRGAKISEISHGSDESGNIFMADVTTYIHIPLKSGSQMWRYSKLVVSFVNRWKMRRNTGNSSRIWHYKWRPCSCKFL